MMVSANRFRSIGWIALLLVCGALVMVLAFRVNALRSQVHRTEQQIVSLRKEKLYLETEVETRANQQQLKLWNDVEFGYIAPGASQYLSSERQLAAFAKPDEANAPTPIRVASADNAVAAEVAFPAIVSRLTGEFDLGASEDHSDANPNTSAGALTPQPSAIAADHDAATAGLGARLAMVGSAIKSSSATSGKSGSKVKGQDSKTGLTKTGVTHSHDGTKPARAGKESKLVAAPESRKSSAPSTAKSGKPAAKPIKASKSAP